MGKQITILGQRIDNIKSRDLLLNLEQGIAQKKRRHLVTVNAEFLVHAATDTDFRAVLHAADLRTADGIGILWAAKFLSLPQTSVLGLRYLQAYWQAIYSLLGVVFSPGWIRSVIGEKISGTDLIWQIGALAQKNNYSIYALGGFGDTPKKVTEALLKRFPTLQIAGFWSGKPEEAGLIDRINESKADILLVAFGQVVQEKWIAKNLQKLNIFLAVGLGGTFDYLAGKRPLAPQILRYIGLEWAYRLVTQPHRFFRIINAVPVLIGLVVRSRFQLLKPYRKNVVGCILNGKKQILICSRKSAQTGKEHWQFPQGGIEEGESVLKGFEREMREELGVENLKILSVINDLYAYDWPVDISDSLYVGKFRGQSQSVVFAQLPQGGKVVLDNDEFERSEWVDQNSVSDRVHPIRREIATKIINELRKINV